jgi:hypothetical protein
MGAILRTFPVWHRLVVGCIAGWQPAGRLDFQPATLAIQSPAPTGRTSRSLGQRPRFWPYLEKALKGRAKTPPLPGRDMPLIIPLITPTITNHREIKNGSNL